MTTFAVLQAIIFHGSHNSLNHFCHFYHFHYFCSMSISLHHFPSCVTSFHSTFAHHVHHFSRILTIVHESHIFKSFSILSQIFASFPSVFIVFFILQQFLSSFITFIFVVCRWGWGAALPQPPRSVSRPSMLEHYFSFWIISACFMIFHNCSS